MNSISEDCEELKKVYDLCFDHWYAEKFLKGNPKDQTCKVIYEHYHACVKEAIKKLDINIPKIEYPAEEKE